ncbi:hypothetical protein J5N97_003177 [Dioscorea zingiberensis]|uniref:Uncharacterized protein n=1 Tax=Dioscorea zingiberensis TaxID=325984 RepID=A0A9D5D464_9LILI|nr:hypothetical protein J5N97_003177 [Dioscorea zingiberensis]
MPWFLVLALAIEKVWWSSIKIIITWTWRQRGALVEEEREEDQATGSRLCLQSQLEGFSADEAQVQMQEQQHHQKQNHCFTYDTESYALNFEEDSDQYLNFSDILEARSSKEGYNF